MIRFQCAIVLLSLFFTFVSPSYGGNRELAAEVMEIHDIAMAKMTHMYELRIQLKELEKSSGATPATSAAITHLQDAHKAMMQWMRAYKAPQTEQEFERAEPYLQGEKVKIERVADDIGKSIKAAEQLLK